MTTEMKPPTILIWVYSVAFCAALGVAGWIVFRAIVMLALGAVCPC